MRAGEKLESPSGRGLVELLNQLPITKTCCTVKAPQQQWNYRKIVRDSSVKSEGGGEGCSAPLDEPGNSVAAVFNNFLISGMSRGC